MGAFREIANSFLAMARKIAELHLDVDAVKKELSATKVVAESALKKAKDSDSRAEMAEKAEKVMASNNAELYQDVEVLKKELAAKVVAESALNKANKSDNRAEMAEKAEKAMASKNAELLREVEAALKKANESDKRAEEAENAMARKNAEIYRDVEVAENALKRAEKAEEAEKAMARKSAEVYRDAEVAKKELAAAKMAAENALKKAQDADNRAVLNYMSFIQINNNYLTRMKIFFRKLRWLWRNGKQLSKT